MANTDHNEAARKKALADAYAAKLRERRDKRTEGLTKDQRELFHYINHSAYAAFCAEMESALRQNDVKPSEYITTKLSWLFGTVIEPAQKEALLYFADRIRDHPYATSHVRRSFRAQSYSAYTKQLARLIQSYGYSQILDEPLDRILNRDLNEDALAYLDTYTWEGCGYNEWQVAYALDSRDAAAEDAVRRILTEENGSGMMTHALIRGILLSRRSDFHQLLGKLLLAARLQEGLRQAICESADCGTAEGFITLLKVIAENNLIRFSSVKRAVGTWLGIMSEETRDLDRVSEKSVRLMLDCLCDHSLRNECLASEDAMKIYIALWSFGFESIESALAEVETIARSGSHHQLLTAGYFVLNLDAPYYANRIAKRVLALHNGEGEEDILAVWLQCFLPKRVFPLWDSVRYNRPIDWSLWFDSKEEIGEYYALIRRIYRSLSGKTKVFSPCIFPWYEAKIAKSDLAALLCILAAFSEENEKIDEAAALLKECDSNLRSQYFEVLLSRPRTVCQRKTVLESIADKESYTRRSAVKIAMQIELNEDEYRLIESLLRFKGADIRENVMKLLMRQSDERLQACILRLLDSGKEEVRLGALDMLMQLKKDDNRSALADAVIPKLSQMTSPTAKEKILIDTLCPEQSVPKAETASLFTDADKYLPTEFDGAYTAKAVTVYARYFPDSELPKLLGYQKSGFSIFSKLKNALSEPKPCPSALSAAEDLMSLSRFIDAHKDETYSSPWGEHCLIGAQSMGFYNGSEIAAEGLWKQWAEENKLTNGRVIRAAVLYHAYKEAHTFATATEGVIRSLFGVGFEVGKSLPYDFRIGPILDYLTARVPSEERRLLGYATAIWFMRCVPDSQVLLYTPSERPLPKHQSMTHLLAHQQIHFLYRYLVCRNDENLPYTFPLAVAVMERCIAAIRAVPFDSSFPGAQSSYYQRHLNERYLQESYGGYYLRSDKALVGIRAYLLAAYRGIISMRALYQFIFEPSALRESLDLLSNIASAVREQGKLIDSSKGRGHRRRLALVQSFLGHEGEWSEEERKLLNFTVGVYDTVIPIVLDSECKRGDSPAQYSNGIQSISRIYGVRAFVTVLTALGNDTLSYSNSSWNPSGIPSRQASLRHLLMVCIPNEDDTVERLRAELTGKQISTKRLIEAALFSPEWIGLIGAYLGIDSFESVCYYFMAHMNERFDDKRKAIIARYTPLSEEELNLGAFDLGWFRAAYASIGEKEFNLIYDAAKYISEGAKHSRARKYADAVLGKFDIAETEEAISAKRNKDLLMAYALIPLGGEDDLCRRYLFIQRFRKESKQFGSQRSAAEGKASDMALTNLALNADYADTMRLTLRMETKVIDDSRALLQEQVIDGLSLRLTIDDNGKTELVVAKDGKALKSLPAKLKKHPTAMALAEMKKTLNEQYRRTRVMLEEAMENGTVFTMREIAALSEHPVVCPMLKKLVLISGETLGFPSASGLTDADGRLQALPEDAPAVIAHPFMLYRCGQWQAYQRYLFENRIAQPFRQVFRELYIKTEEEKETYHSLRYAGHQIQPAKTAATLKSRRWIADIENGLQKVYYKENIVAEIYALADWFSPADIEAPTLEWVCFSDRQTGKEIKISDVPDLIFSEVMRDVDLAVSVAHAGGVDPETSHSTVEMRAAIISFVLPMFRIENVRLQGVHALIDGKLANYALHLGSGVVHQIGGAMIPVLPVHSQHRGKVFLPFVDDDPKTAEIISKIILFAEDGKIKDPSILSAISR